jgi:hypothetical protein
MRIRTKSHVTLTERIVRAMRTIASERRMSGRRRGQEHGVRAEVESSSRKGGPEAPDEHQHQIRAADTRTGSQMRYEVVV